MKKTILYILFTTLLVIICGSYPVKAQNKSYLQAEALLTKGEKAYGQEKYADAIKYFLQSKNIAELNRLAELNYYATVSLGACYYIISESGKALSYYYEAYEIHQKNNLDTKLLETMLSGIAGVYFDEGNFEKAKEIVIKTFDISPKDTFSIITYTTSRALIENDLHNFEQTYILIDSAMRYSANRPKDLVRSKVILSEALYMEKKYDEVLKLSEEILNSKYVSSSDKTITYTYLISIYEQRKDTKRALELIEKAEKTAPIRQKVQLYENAAEIYRRIDKDKALAYKDSILIYTDSLNRAWNQQLIENSRIKFEVLDAKMAMDEEMTRLKTHRLLSVLLSCICILIVIITMIIVHNQRIKSRQNKKMMELQLEKEQQEKLLVEQQMKETELLAKLQKERLENSIAQKNKEISIATMFMSSRNQLISDLLSSLSKIKEVHQSTPLQELTIHLKQLLKDSTQHDDFLIKFEASNPSFISALRTRHPELSPSDIRFLAFIRMNMTSNEIASLLNITPESFKRKKIRISQKLGLETSSMLYNYISNMQ